MEEKRGIHNLHKAFKWNGIKDELPWILFIIFLLISAYSYLEEVKACREMTQTRCYQDCRLTEYIQEFKKANPGASIQCEYKNGTGYYCNFYGLEGQNIPFGDEIRETISNLSNFTIKYEN